MDNINHNDMLIAEFEYISKAAFQVSEDRAKVSQFYVLTVASFVATIFGNQIQSTNQQALDLVFTVLFFVLTLNGWVTLIHLVQLRLAWLDSIKAMNEIKSFYIKNYPDEEYSSAFMWKDSPEIFKRQSISFLLAIQVSLLSALTLGTALFKLSEILVPSMDAKLFLAIFLLVGLISTALELKLYVYLLNHPKSAKDAKN